MRLIFNTLTMQNFKSHQDLVVNFGEVTKITGDNAKGKSTIPESLPWLLYGTDAFGSKLDPTPITYEAEETKVSLLLSVDGKELLLGRGLKKGKATYYINDVPSKAKEFNEVVEQLFDKELFLSLFNPNYFFTLHWEKQRAMLLQYVTSPANKEVIKHMPDEQGKYLGTLLKKHSLEDIKKIHAESKTSLDKKYIAAQSRTKTLKEQMEQYAPTVALESLKVEESQIRKQISQIYQITKDAETNNKKIVQLAERERHLAERRVSIRKSHERLKEETIQDVCLSCGEPLNETSRQKAEEDKIKRLQPYKDEYKQASLEMKSIIAEKQQMVWIDIDEELEKIKQLENKHDPLLDEIKKHDHYARLQEQVETAKADEKDTLTSLNESIFILDSIKAFKAKEAELQAKKVQALFETLSIRLFETQKNGEVKNTFEIEMNGKPYRVLSLSEGIRAGLELRDVLSEQSNLITPVFVDNAESITSFKQPVGQLILSRVVAGEELKIEGGEA